MPHRPIIVSGVEATPVPGTRRATRRRPRARAEVLAARRAERAILATAHVSAPFQGL
ncbi:MAG TPA: hypothetical protein VFV66_20120 [Nonomuraea sp.]|nr:hypothetical protein [Nonomuraea sp.]